jgi:hypothetical protein
MEVEPTPEMLCIANRTETMDNAQHCTGVMNQALPQLLENYEL